jgi:photosystem II stability/assembly factor-like uncharacterized protein
MPTPPPPAQSDLLKIPTARDPWQVVNMAPGIVLSGANVGGSASGQQLTISAYGTSGNVQWNLEGSGDSGTVLSEFTAPPFVAGSSLGFGGGGGRAGGGAARVAQSDSVQRPAPRWRVLAGGGVDRSTDGGSTWMRMTTTGPVFITAGAAPSPTSCWFVGRGGVVLVSTDGETFIRADLPEHPDLKSVTATSARVATVVTAADVTYRTSDGGKTWKRQD